MARGDEAGIGRGRSGAQPKKCETCDKALPDSRGKTLCQPFRFNQTLTCGRPRPDEGFY